MSQGFYVSQVSLDFPIFPPQPPKCWDYIGLFVCATMLSYHAAPGF